MKTGVIIAAAGSGKRMGAEGNKVLLSLDGKPMLAHSLELFAHLPEVDELVVVARDVDLAVMSEIVAEYAGDKPTKIVVGGAERQESVYNGLMALSKDTDWVLIHDGARPYVTSEIVYRALLAVQKHGAVGVGVPVKDTIKQVEKDFVRKPLPRPELRAMQTPQAFAYELILGAHQEAKRRGLIATDDCALLEELGKPVYIVSGDYGNIKITTPEDLTTANSFFVGYGWDVHRLVEDRPLILCGVEIPWEKGLSGHSDADVAVHAVMDAMLGAVGKGDIGEHFPDIDPRYKGISSLELLHEVLELLKRDKLRVNNVDLTIMAQAPKLSPYKAAMRAKLAELIGIAAGRINIKATTAEGLGFVGREEGIAAAAVVSLCD